MTKLYLLLFMVGCRTSSPSSLPVTQAAEFDATMRGYRDNGVADVITLPRGVYLTRGNLGWSLSPQDSLVGSGIGKTVIRCVDPLTRFVVNGWVAGGNRGGRVSDLTIDCNATPANTNTAPCGIGARHWSDAVIERVRVIGAGSYVAKYRPDGTYNDNSESFGIILSACSNSVVRDCTVERNTGGYVSSFCISGQNVTVTNCVAGFGWEPSYQMPLQAFTMAGDSRKLAYLNNRTRDAGYAFYCDTGTVIDGLTLTGNTGSVKRYPFGNSGSVVNLQPTLEYHDLIIAHNTITIR